VQLSNAADRTFSHSTLEKAYLSYNTISQHDYPLIKPAHQHFRLHSQNAYQHHQSFPLTVTFLFFHHLPDLVSPLYIIYNSVDSIITPSTWLIISTMTRRTCILISMMYQ